MLGRERGKFIVLYGANNIGKSTQVLVLAEKLRPKVQRLEITKYPIYDSPSGIEINEVLRHGKRMSEDELQRRFAQNRRDYEPILENKLDNGIWIIAEDYKGTGIAWGYTRGIDLDLLEEINVGLLEPDLSILLDGNRFLNGIERGHRNEDDVVWDRSRESHLFLAKRYKWTIVNANGSIEEVGNRLFTLVSKHLFCDKIAPNDSTTH